MRIAEDWAERRKRLKQVFCYRAGEETGDLILRRGGGDLPLAYLLSRPVLGWCVPRESRYF